MIDWLLHIFRPKKLQCEKELYLKYAKSKMAMSPNGSKSPTEEGKNMKTSLDCATIALKVLKTSIKYQTKFREKHSINNCDGDTGESGKF